MKDFRRSKDFKKIVPTGTKVASELVNGDVFRVDGVLYVVISNRVREDHSVATVTAMTLQDYTTGVLSKDTEFKFLGGLSLPVKKERVARSRTYYAEGRIIGVPTGNFNLR